MRVFVLVAILLLPATAARAEAPARIDDVIKKIEARFEPAEARPGLKVTLKIELKLAEGWHTYPTKQPEKDFAAAVNKIRFTEGGDIAGFEAGRCDREGANGCDHGRRRQRFSTQGH